MDPGGRSEGVLELQSQEGFDGVLERSRVLQSMHLAKQEATAKIGSSGALCCLASRCQFSVVFDRFGQSCACQVCSVTMCDCDALSNPAPLILNLGLSGQIALCIRIAVLDAFVRGQLIVML